MRTRIKICQNGIRSNHSKLQIWCVFILLFFSIINCRSERSQCYKDNGFYFKADFCGLALVSYSTVENIKNSTREGKPDANMFQLAGDVSLVQCVVDTRNRKECDKKSDVFPHRW